MPTKMSEESIFIKLLGDYPLIRILNFLLIFREFDYSLTDIADNSGVAWSTLNLLWPKMESMQIVAHTRNVGKAKMYKLNTQNKTAQDLIRFADNLIKDHTYKTVLRHKQKVTA